MYSDYLEASGMPIAFPHWKRLKKKKLQERHNTSETMSSTANASISEPVLILTQNDEGFTSLPKTTVSPESLAKRKHETAAEKDETPNKKRFNLEQEPSNNDSDSEFSVKSKLMDDNLLNRMDEWRCMYMQILEETLSTVLQKQPRTALKLAPPYSICEAVHCFENINMFKQNTEINKYIINLGLHQANMSKKVIAPEDFVKALGCGIRLLENLKKVDTSIQIQDGHNALQELMRQIETDLNIKLPINPRKKRPDNNVFFKRIHDITELNIKIHFQAWEDYEYTTTDELAISDINVEINNIPGETQKKCENNIQTELHGIITEHGWISGLKAHIKEFRDSLEITKQNLIDSQKESSSREHKKKSRLRAFEMDKCLKLNLTFLKNVLREEPGPVTDAVRKYLNMATSMNRMNRSIFDCTKDI